MNVAASQIKALQSSVPNVKALSQSTVAKEMVNLNKNMNYISNSIKPSVAAVSAVSGNEQSQNLSLAQQRQIFYYANHQITPINPIMINTAIAQWILNSIFKSVWPSGL